MLRFHQLGLRFRELLEADPYIVQVYTHPEAETIREGVIWLFQVEKTPDWEWVRDYFLEAHIERFARLYAKRPKEERTRPPNKYAFEVLTKGMHGTVRFYQKCPTYEEIRDEVLEELAQGGDPFFNSEGS